MLKLKLQYFGCLMQRADSLEKSLMLGKIEGRRRRGRQRMRRLDGTTDSMGMSLSKLNGHSEGQGSLLCCSPWGCKELDMTEQVNNRYSHMHFSGGSAVKNPPANAGDMSLVSGSGSSPGEGNGNPLHFSSLENPMDRGAWWVAKPQGCKESDMA